MTRNVMTPAATSAATPNVFETFVVDPDHSEVGFSVRHLLSRTRARFGRYPWGGERAGFSTEIELNRKEFGMVWNAALDNGGFVLGDEVRVTIDLETLRQAQEVAA